MHVTSKAISLALSLALCSSLFGPVSAFASSDVDASAANQERTIASAEHPDSSTAIGDDVPAPAPEQNGESASQPADAIQTIPDMPEPTYAGDLKQTQDASALESATIAPNANEATSDNEKPVTIELNQEQTQANLVLSGDDLIGASKVLVPTWSVANGQDDIVWYEASRMPDGNWELRMDLSRHKSVGKFIVHVYKEANGALSFVGASEFEVVPPTAKAEITQTPNQVASGLFDIVVDIQSKTPVRRLQLPTWSAAGGQDDITWYDASKVGEGKYAVRDVSCIDSRRSPGSYISHAYVELATGAYIYVAATSKGIEIPGASFSAKMNDQQTHLDIVASGGIFDIADKVLLPTWSSNGGQNDIRWYEARASIAPMDANASPKRTWTYSVPISNHKDVGDYIIHCYAQARGGQAFASSSIVNVPAPSCEVCLVQDKDGSTTQSDNGAFDIEIKDLKAPGSIIKVQAPTWSAAGGQDDIVWYEASRVGNTNDWVVRNVPCLSRNRDAGDYITHVYVTCSNGITAFAGGKTASMKVGDPTIEIDNVNDSTIKIKVSGGVFGKADSVSIPVWSSSNGQDDIRWYNAARQADGSWVATVQISDHRDFGTYYVHTYANAFGATKWGGISTTFDIQRPKASVQSASNDKDGTITVTVKDIESKSGVSKVQIPTWTEPNGQDDIIWHDAKTQDDGSYVAVIPAGEHNCEEGPYISHVYITGKNNVSSMTGSSKGSLALEDYIYVKGAMGSGYRQLYVKNPSASGSVKVPTWSSDAGQDDIVWYDARPMSNNLYCATIDCKNLRHEGTVISHIYAGDKMVASTTFQVNKNDVWSISGDPVLDGYLRQIIDQHGTNLYDLFTYVGRYPYVNGSTYPTGNWSIPFAKEMYQNHGGNCYRYASLFCWLARAVGYDANVVSGHVPSRSKGWVPHGWVEINMGGTIYICDPDMYLVYPRYNFYMITYSNTPYTYRK